MRSVTHLSNCRLRSPGCTPRLRYRLKHGLSCACFTGASQIQGSLMCFVLSQTCETLHVTQVLTRMHACMHVHLDPCCCAPHALTRTRQRGNLNHGIQLMLSGPAQSLLSGSGHGREPGPGSSAIGTNDSPRHPEITTETPRDLRQSRRGGTVLRPPRRLCMHMRDS